MVILMSDSARAIAELQLSVEGSGHIESVTFLNQPVGLACLAKILGVGKNRLRKSGNMIPDMRFGKCKEGSSSESFSIDAFLTTLYNSVAETLPDRWVKQMV